MRAKTPTMNVSLTDALRDVVDERLRSGLYGNASEYVRELIRRDEEAARQLRALYQAGIDSGEPVPMSTKVLSGHEDTMDAEVEGRRRRKHSAQFKLQVMQACRQPGVSIAPVALSFGLNANLVRRWLNGRVADVGQLLPMLQAGKGQHRSGTRPAGQRRA